LLVASVAQAQVREDNGDHHHRGDDAEEDFHEGAVPGAALGLGLLEGGQALVVAGVVLTSWSSRWSMASRWSTTGVRAGGCR
jgi:hypothetical protein